MVGGHWHSMAWWEGPSSVGQDSCRDSGEGSPRANYGGSFFRGHRGRHDAGMEMESKECCRRHRRQRTTFGRSFCRCCGSSARGHQGHIDLAG